MVKKSQPKPKAKAKSPKTGTIADQKSRLYAAALPHIAFDGFGMTALTRAAKQLGVDPVKAELLFGNAERGLLEYYLGDIHAQLEEKLAGLQQKPWKIREKIAHGVRKKLEILTPLREVERRAVMMLMRPRYADLAIKSLHRTCDAIWMAAGDRSTDWNYYTKRGLLAGVYASTLLFWLQDDSDGFEDSFRFLNRRIDNVMTIQKIKSAFANRDAIKSGFDIFRKFAA